MTQQQQTQKDFKRFNQSLNNNFKIIDTLGVPHPYMITEKHLEHNDSMYLGKEQIDKMELDHGSMCGFKCGLSYAEHKQALLVECKKNMKTKKGFLNRELKKYLLSIKDQATKEKFEGFAFLDKSDKK